MKLQKALGIVLTLLIGSSTFAFEQNGPKELLVVTGPGSTATILLPQLKGLTYDDTADSVYSDPHCSIRASSLGQGQVTINNLIYNIKDITIKDSIQQNRCPELEGQSASMAEVTEVQLTIEHTDVEVQYVVKINSDGGVYLTNIGERLHRANGLVTKLH